MAVIVKYVVERNGEEKMTFTSKAEADAYDKMLDMADDLFTLLEQSNLIEDDDKKEELSLYLAQNKEEVLFALGAKRRPVAKKSPAKSSKMSDEMDAEETDAQQADASNNANASNNAETSSVQESTEQESSEQQSSKEPAAKTKATKKTAAKK